MRALSGPTLALLGCLGLLSLGGCSKSDKVSADAAASSQPATRGQAPPPAESAAQPGACKNGGGEVKDALSAPFFPKLVDGYCVNPEGETQAFGEKAAKPIGGICSLFDGGCELYNQYQIKRLVSIDYVDGGGGQGTVNTVLSQFASAEHGYGMFTRRLAGDEDPAREDMPRTIDVGAPAALGSSSLYAWKGPYLLELSYVNTDESGDEKRMKASAAKILPQIAKAIIEKLPGASTTLPNVALLSSENQLPLGVSYGLQKALEVDGTGPFAVGYYREGEKRYRQLVLIKSDPEQAKDVLKTFAKQKGALEEKNVGEGAVKLMVQDSPDAPKAEWIVARKGKLVLGVGDEPFVLSPGESAAEHEKVSLSKDDKVKKLKAALGAAKLGPSSLHPPTHCERNHGLRAPRASPHPPANAS